MPVLTRRQAQVLRPRYDLTRGLVGWWTFDDGTARDISGLQNNGTLQNAPKYIAGRVIGVSSAPGALNFNGTNQYVSAPAYDIKSNGTMAFWAYVTGDGTFSAPNSINVFIANNISDEKNGWEADFNVSTKKVVFYLANNGTTGTNLVSNSSFVYNRWYHIAFTYDGATRIIYINGVSDASVATTLNGSSTNPWLIGYNVSGTYPHYFQGYLDDIRIYNRALSSGEIHSLYASAFLQSDTMLDGVMRLQTNNPRFINFPMLGM